MAETLEEGTARRVQMSELYRDLTISAVNESLKSGLQSVLKMLEGHNIQVGPGNFASKQAIIACFQNVAEDVEGKLNDAFAELIIDLQRGLKEYEHEST